MASQVAKTTEPLIRLPLIPTALVAVVVGVIIQRRAPCAVSHSNWSPGSRGPRGPSDGDTVIRDLQVFYHSVRLEQISF